MSQHRPNQRFPQAGWAWPRGPRALLLQAALSPDGTKALAALRAWTRTHDFDTITFADHRILAAIAERHGQALADQPYYQRLKGLQRQLWTRARMQVHAVLPVLDAMTAAGVEVMLLKGAARIAVDPAAQRQRSHQDIDILVRPAQMQRAAAVLSADGWQSARGDSALAAVARIAAARAINFQKLPWGDMDIHASAWHGGNFHHALDAELWTRARPATYFGLPVYVPEPVERLAMTLSHGAWSPEAHSDWLVDAADILSRERIDWTRLADIARKRRIETHLRIGLSYLQEEIGLDLPDAAQDLVKGRCQWAPLLIAHTPADMSKPLRGLRDVVHAIARSRRDRSRDGGVPPLRLAIARPIRPDAPLAAVACTATLVPPAPLEAGYCTVTALLRITAPDVRRRLQMELNSADENLARFRIFLFPSASGGVEARISARVRLTARAATLTLAARPSCLLVPGMSPETLAKRQALPFKVLSCNFRPDSNARKLVMG